MRYRVTEKTLIRAGIAFVLLLSIGVIIYLSVFQWTGITSFNPFNNKSSLNPTKYTSYHLGEGENFDFASLYIEHPYTRKAVMMQEELDALYKKKIDWSLGNITPEEYVELQDLSGYEANKRSDNVVVLSTPSIEELKEFKEDVVYRTTEDGVLILNQLIKEYDEGDRLIKTYMYQFKLKYNVENGMVRYL